MSFLQTMKDLMDPNSVGQVNNTPIDPDLKTIIELEKQSKQYADEITKNKDEIKKIEVSILEIQKKMSQFEKGSLPYKTLQDNALPLLRRKKLLEEANTYNSQKQANFDVLSLKLKDARRNKHESNLLKEANIRMQMNQDELNTDDLKKTFKETRTLNKNSDKASQIMSSSITLDDFNANDDSLLLELSNFENLELNDNYQYSDYLSTPVSVQQQQQQQQQQPPRRLINNNNNVLGNGY